MINRGKGNSFSFISLCSSLLHFLRLPRISEKTVYFKEERGWGAVKGEVKWHRLAEEKADGSPGRFTVPEPLHPSFCFVLSTAWGAGRSVPALQTRRCPPTPPRADCGGAFRLRPSGGDRGVPEGWGRGSLWPWVP